MTPQQAAPNTPTPLTLDMLVALALASPPTVRWQLGAEHRDRFPVLKSQRQNPSRWKGATVYPLALDLAEKLAPLFPPATTRWRSDSRTWLTLPGICKRLGLTDISARIAVATKAKQETEAANARAFKHRQLSDACVAFMIQLRELSEVLDLDTPDVPNTSALRNQRDDIIHALANLVEAIPYVTTRIKVGETVTVPQTDRARYSQGRQGLVLSVAGRVIRVDVPQQDGSMAPETFDVLEVRDGK